VVLEHVLVVLPCGLLQPGSGQSAGSLGAPAASLAGSPPARAASWA
jgi:hypothetical protein